MYKNKKNLIIILIITLLIGCARNLSEVSPPASSGLGIEPPPNNNSSKIELATFSSGADVFWIGNTNATNATNVVPHILPSTLSTSPSLIDTNTEIVSRLMVYQDKAGQEFVAYVAKDNSEKYVVITHGDQGKDTISLEIDVKNGTKYTLSNKTKVPATLTKIDNKIVMYTFDQTHLYKINLTDVTVTASVITGKAPEEEPLRIVAQINGTDPDVYFQTTDALYQKRQGVIVRNGLISSSQKFSSSTKYKRDLPIVVTSQFVYFESNKNIMRCSVTGFKCNALENFPDVDSEDFGLAGVQLQKYKIGNMMADADDSLIYSIVYRNKTNLISFKNNATLKPIMKNFLGGERIYTTQIFSSKKSEQIKEYTKKMQVDKEVGAFSDEKSGAYGHLDITMMANDIRGNTNTLYFPGKEHYMNFEYKRGEFEPIKAGFDERMKGVIVKIHNKKISPVVEDQKLAGEFYIKGIDKGFDANLKISDKEMYWDNGKRATQVESYILKLAKWFGEDGLFEEDLYKGTNIFELMYGDKSYNATNPNICFDYEGKMKLLNALTEDGIKDLNDHFKGIVATEEEETNWELADDTILLELITRYLNENTEDGKLNKEAKMKIWLQIMTGRKIGGGPNFQYFESVDDALGLYNYVLKVMESDNPGFDIESSEISSKKIQDKLESMLKVDIPIQKNKRWIWNDDIGADGKSHAWALTYGFKYKNEQFTPGQGVNLLYALIDISQFGKGPEADIWMPLSQPSGKRVRVYENLLYPHSIANPLEDSDLVNVKRWNYCKKRLKTFEDINVIEFMNINATPYFFVTDGVTSIYATMQKSTEGCNTPGGSHDMNYCNRKELITALNIGLEENPSALKQSKNNLCIINAETKESRCLGDIIDFTDIAIGQKYIYVTNGNDILLY
jgi:hypothetical protein